MTQLNYETPPPEFEMHCPGCGHLVYGQNPLQTFFKCPDCGTEFIPPRGEQSDSRDVELSGLHIQNVSVLRRATYRTRSHFIIGSAASLVATVEMLLMLFRSWQYHTWLGAIASLCVGTALAVLFWHCLTRALQLTKELHESKLESPTEPQDFSKLGDGSQRIRDLENLVD